MNDKLKVAFRLNGGMGTFIIEMNFIQHFFDKFSDKVDISVFSFSEEMSTALYGEQYFVSHYGSRDELLEKEYDFSIDLNWFPKVIYFNEIRFLDIDKDGELLSLVKKWRNFSEDIRTKAFFTPDTNMFDPNIHIFITAKNQNRLQAADIDNSLGIGRSYLFSIPVENEEEILRKYDLFNCRYITVQQGVDSACNTKFSPKQWPNEYYSRLCEICKSRFPDIKTVQLGEVDNNLTINGVDYCLLGKTTIQELKVILKNAVLHIDGDCGMVHLRRAMHSGPNIVLYGNLPDNIYGYDEDYRVKSDICSYGCAKLFNAWKCRCYKSKAPECMTAIQPERIANIISEHIEKLNSGEVVADAILTENKAPLTIYDRIMSEPNIKLDSDWADGWLKKWEKNGIFDYRLERVKISELRFVKLTSQGYTPVPLSKSPAYQHLQGDTKAYPKYMNLYKKYEPESERSEERFSELLESLSQNEYDDSRVIAVDAMYKILDGAHRAAWLMNKYGEDYEITVLKLYCFSTFWLEQ